MMISPVVRNDDEDEDMDIENGEDCRVGNRE